MFIEAAGRRVDFRPWKPLLGRVFNDRFALDTETTFIVGHDPPGYVLGAASDGVRGFFLTPQVVADFLSAHWGSEIILHHGAFDLAVLDKLFRGRGLDLDVYKLVDERRIWDTMILHKLHGLATLGHAHQGKDQSTLERCAALYLDLHLPKDVRDQHGNEVRTSWGLWQGRPPGVIPPAYLEYLGRDVLVTLGVFDRLLEDLYQAVENAGDAFGYAGHNWLEEMMSRYGVQTHDLQVMAAVALDHIQRTGIGLDMADRNRIVAQVQVLVDDLKEQLRAFGYKADEPGCDNALQFLIRRTLAEHPDVDIPRTPTGLYSTAGQDLDELAEVSDSFAIYKEFRQVRILLNNYLAKMDVVRLHPHYDLLKNSGRTSASAPNIQNIPRKRKKKRPESRDAFDLRRCFVPAEGKVFYVADYGSIELRTLAQTLITQFGLQPVMGRQLNEGIDLHRFVAARMKLTGHPEAAAILADAGRYAEFMASLSDEDRGAAKPANFGLPAGMGVRTLAAYARTQYEQPYTEEDAAVWKQAWLDSFPEMAVFLRDNLDVGLLLARDLNLTPARYAAATGRQILSYQDEQDLPSAVLGLMALKTLREAVPATGKGRAYEAAELDFFWESFRPIARRLDAPHRDDLLNRRPGFPLSFAVKKLVSRAGVFTVTGRLRARASYSARRNTTFQGAASDGAKLALYRLWRAGYAIAAFIHDEVVVEVDAGADLGAVKGEIDGILIDAMQEICPDIKIEVEGTFRRRWGKNRDDEVRIPASAALVGAATA